MLYCRISHTVIQDFDLFSESQKSACCFTCLYGCAYAALWSCIRCTSECVNVCVSGCQIEEQGDSFSLCAHTKTRPSPPFRELISTSSQISPSLSNTTVMRHTHTHTHHTHTSKWHCIDFYCFYIMLDINTHTNTNPRNRNDLHLYN